MSLHFLGIADADEKQRHAHLPRVLRRLDQILAFGRDAVGEHDDGGQRRAAKIVEYLPHGHAQLARIVLRLRVQIVDGIEGRSNFLGRCHVLEAMGAAGAVIDVDTHFALRQHGRQPIAAVGGTASRRSVTSAFARESR